LLSTFQYYLNNFYALNYGYRNKGANIIILFELVTYCDYLLGS